MIEYLTWRGNVKYYVAKTRQWIEDFRFKRYVIEGDTLPKGYGVAWYEIQTARHVAMPYPLSYVAGFIRDMYWRMRHGWKPAAETEAYRAAYKNAAEAAWQALERQRMEIKLEGWREGYKRAWEQIEADVKKFAETGEVGTVTVVAPDGKIH